MRNIVALLGTLIALSVGPSEPKLYADDLSVVRQVPTQPFVSATERLIEALDYSGTPLDETVVNQLRSAGKLENKAMASQRIQEILDPLCLVEVHINPESRVKVKSGPVEPRLLEQGWRAFLVKVHNEAGINPEMMVESPNAAEVYEKGQGAREKPRSDEDLVDPSDVPNRWLDLSMLNRQPMTRRLSGLKVEYRVVLLFARDAGKHEASLSFNIGQGTQDIGFRNAVPILFDCDPAVDVRLNIKDVDGEPCVAALEIRDSQNRVYPNPAKRLAPDFFFHNQVYRGDGESILLPPGDYKVKVTRGPEYEPIEIQVEVPEVKRHSIDIPLKRWIHLAKQNWFSGDHHVHAAGCSHYDSPTEGVGPADMMRHILGEDLNVGCVLSWGPCWYTQKNFFEGDLSKLSTPTNLMRYDVEVSGFPSSHAGHLCLLKLSEDDYPGTTMIEEWPTWTYPVLKWGQDQGGVVGYSHSGWGLALPDVMPDGTRKFVGTPWGGATEGWKGSPANSLPDYSMPLFDGIGANEYIVTGALGVCDFISAVDTPSIWELNIWYHTLNCGITTRISGETDFPCIYGERVGLGRVYVKLDDDKRLNYEDWVSGLKDGRSYCGDGMSHIVDFRINDFEMGTRAAPGRQASRLDLASPSSVTVTFDAAALLQPEPNDETRRIKGLRLDDKPYWNIERCRIGESRKVPVEVVVNGQVVSTQEMEADGNMRSFEVPIEIESSSWVAVRILPSVHTNPIFVHVNDKPIHADSKSAQWCIDAVRQCWESKQAMIHDDERDAAEEAYQKAEDYYRSVLDTITPGL
ncbi:hypothetical protein Pla22_29510 [Rubripirellula amarantea]|uniref:Uncharacterized protein n=1 Tax=Rubripirellula amarantea TaxID=2527999 RepID=A0A5C5WHR4_9BACT|nr:CehA/McbA family metallohydrolase [Rubripirellula amarantea]TWT50210.1 hypothetical protein Pla22_29510 [Rubripirellula amarantea]